MGDARLTDLDSGRTDGGEYQRHGRRHLCPAARVTVRERGRQRGRGRGGADRPERYVPRHTVEDAWYRPTRQLGPDTKKFVDFAVPGR